MAEEAGQLERLFQPHPMITPDMPRREDRKFILGRVAPSGPSDVIVCTSDFVSRRHCEIYFRNGAYWIKDLGSLNGTFLNGQKIIAQTDRELRVGDYIGLGLSHDSPEIQAPEYFAFQFKAKQFEVILLDEDDEDISTSAKNKSTEAKNVKKTGEDEIEIVGTISKESLNKVNSPIIAYSEASTSTSKISSNNPAVNAKKPTAASEASTSAGKNIKTNPAVNAKKPTASSEAPTSASRNIKTNPAVNANKPTASSEASTSIGRSNNKSVDNSKKTKTTSEASIDSNSSSNSDKNPAVNAKKTTAAPGVPTPTGRKSNGNPVVSAKKATATSEATIGNNSSKKRAIVVDAKKTTTTSEAAIDSNSEGEDHPVVSAKKAKRNLESSIDSISKPVAVVKPERMVVDPPKLKRKAPSHEELPETILKLKHVMQSKGGLISIRQSILKRMTLSVSSRRRILLQWKESVRKCKSKANNKRSSGSSSSSDRSRDVVSHSSEHSSSSVSAHERGKKRISSNSEHSDYSSEHRHKKSHNRNRRRSPQKKTKDRRQYSRITCSDTSGGSDSLEKIRKYHEKKELKKSSENKKADRDRETSSRRLTPENVRKTTTSSRSRSRSPVSPVSSNSSDYSVEEDNSKEVKKSESTNSNFLKPPGPVHRKEHKNNLAQVRDDIDMEDAYTAKPRGPPRKMILLDNGPMPLSQQKKQQQALQRARMDAQASSSSRPWGYSKPTPVAVDSTIKERLSEIAKRSETTGTQPVHKPSAPAPAIAKNSASKRSEALLASFMAVNQVNRGQQPTFNDRTQKPIPAPRREIPRPQQIPSPNTQMNMPVNKIVSNMTKFNDEKRTDKLAMPPPPPPPRMPPGNPSNIAPSQRNLMEKPGVAHARVVDAKNRQKEPVIVYDYKHQSHVPTAKRNHERQLPVIPEDEVYKAILRWRPNWLQEQLLHKEPPPVTHEREACRTLNEYADYKSYVEIFYPLILLEIWATITQDLFNRNDQRGGVLFPPISEYPIAVDNVNKVQECPMLTHQCPLGEESSFWTRVYCHAVVENQKEIFIKRDLVILKFGICLGGETKAKEVFGFVLSESEVWTPIHSGTIVNSKLMEQNRSAKHKHNFIVVVYLHPGEVIDQGVIASMKRVSYVGPKLRDVRALIKLQNSPLYKQIINCKPPAQLWNPNEVISPHQLISHVAVSKLNPIQKSVVAYVDEAVKKDGPNLLLLHGPPGTGKTRTIVGMIMQMLLNKDKPLKDKKILVCTPSNTAIDEIMMRLQQAIRESISKDAISVVRIGETNNPKLKRYALEERAKDYGSQTSIAASIKNQIRQCEKERTIKEQEIMKEKNKTVAEALKGELREIQIRLQDYKADLHKQAQPKDKTSISSWRQTVLESANVICSTLNSCSISSVVRVFGSKSKFKNPFLCCIVDEASQTTEPETLSPLLLQTEKLILVGDPNQLGATVLSPEAESKDFGQSLFARLHHVYTNVRDMPQAVMMLTQQYRMHPEILSFPNDCFYKGVLKTECVGRADDGNCPLKPYLFLNLSSQETSNHGGQISNDQEAKMVIEILRNIHLVLAEKSQKTGAKKIWSMGVVTPYSTQKNNIINLLKRELPTIAAQVEVSTVDGFQGKEKDIVIISCVRTDDTGFLKNKKRLNVALTRAKHSLLIVGDAHCLKKETMWNSLIENATERSCLQNIPATEWANPGFLRKRLFQALSPTKPQLPNNHNRI